MQLYSPCTKLLDNLGIDIHSAIDDVKEFIRAVVYNGNISEEYVQTRVRLFRGFYRRKIKAVKRTKSILN